jgi:tetratricopeptide (TPR) repeat protein
MGYYNAFDDETILFVNEFTSSKSAQADKLAEQGKSLMDGKKYTEAINIFDQLLAIYPNDGNSCYNKGLCLIRLKKYGEAIPYFDKLFQSNYCFGTRRSKHLF